jgi:CDP-6-deoxy-D-xylo-4-hexulose-3-dehydrase
MAREIDLKYISPSGPLIDQNDLDTVKDALEKKWFTEGRYCNMFLQKLRFIAWQNHGQLCNSGSSANLLAITALSEIRQNKKYIVTCATGFPTTITPIYQNDKIPIFIDVSLDRYEPDYGQLEEVVNKYGDDIAMAVFAHTLGFAFDEWKVFEILQTLILQDNFFFHSRCLPQKKSPI